MAGLAALAVTISKSGFGGALGSLSLPLLLFVLPPKVALGVLLPLFLIADVWVVYIWRRMLNHQILMITCGFGLLGQLLGWLLFDYRSDRLLTLLIGLIAIITALNYGWRRARPGKRTSAEIAALVAQRIWQRGFFWCGLSGVSSFVSLSGGIPAQIFLLPHGLVRQAFVGTLSVYFFVINITKVPFYMEIGIFTGEIMQISLWLTLLIPVGVLMGRWLNQKMSDQIFYDTSHLILLGMGGRLLFGVL
jgi:uncharacterized membrane protein YfcA